RRDQHHHYTARLRQLEVIARDVGESRRPLQHQHIAHAATSVARSAPARCRRVRQPIVRAVRAVINDRPSVAAPVITWTLVITGCLPLQTTYPPSAIWISTIVTSRFESCRSGCSDSNR